ncbi:hypothetical protein V6N11_071073 [Hibiscus sabdariffa]|uniref:Disease resistance protein RPM1 n=1 Tax=Hibiscus sabdariffa TaxID=183260 RepID=A0ABR2A7C7_9ROSI
MELSSSLDPVISKVISVLENEASLQAEVGAEIDEIKLELKAIKAFLEDADRRSGVAPMSETDKQWVASVRDIAYQVEDVVDEFMYHFNKQQQWRGKPSRFFFKLIHFPKDLLVKHQVAVKLQDINKRVKSIADRNQRYQVSRSESRNFDKQIGGEYHRNNWVKNLSESTLFYKYDDLVGIDKAQSKLLGWLMDQELQRTVISVVGMGGLGKTTVVANTFNRQVVKEHFDCCAWITVSQQYVVTELFKSITKELYAKSKEKTDLLINLDSMSYRDLLGALVKFLEPRKYLIVIDDVWSTNLWQDINSALPANMNGSRILLTTRKEDVASFEFGVVKHIFLLEHLPFEESMTLFCKKAFVGKGGQCPPYLESSAAKLVAKCQGLPLAIVALGGLMASKSSITEWDGVYDNLNRELSENDTYFERLKYISLLSYHDLSYTLKQCFLYCCIFPEDYVIKRNRLIRLWMAEGFVEPLKGTVPEVVAERYLSELICRGLLQVERRHASGRPKALKMHDILREFAVAISKSMKFVAKSDGEEEIGDDGIRRWSTEAKGKEMKGASETALSRLRSLLVFAVDETSKSSFNRLPSGFKLMRVLDLEGTPINELPHDMGNLFNLRYLNLTRTQVKELPKSIGKLYNLQSLVMKWTQIKELPAGIVKLKNLRHLIVYGLNGNPTTFDYFWGPVFPSNICLLDNLQILATVEARGDFIKQLGKMTQLRVLGVVNVKETDGQNLCLAIAKMIHLREIGVTSCNEDEQVNMDALESAPPGLEKLYLAGKLEKVPHWFNSLDKLTRLGLCWSRLRVDFLPHIQALPNLGELVLLNAYEGERLCFLEEFQKLKALIIWRCTGLREIVINKGVMPGLQELNIYACHEFTTLPLGWESLPDLKRVDLYDLSPGLVQTICRSKGMDRQTITGITNASNSYGLFAVLAEAAALVSKGVDQVGTSTLAVVSEVGTEVPVVSPIVQQEGVSIYADVEVVFVPAQLTVENTVLDDHSSDQPVEQQVLMVEHVKNRKHAITSLVSEAGLKLDTQEEIVAEVVHVFSRLLGTSDPNVFVPSVGILEELISSSLSIGEADSLIREDVVHTRLSGKYAQGRDSIDLQLCCRMWLDLESIRVVVIIRDVDTHFVLVATPRHVMAGEVGFHDVVPAVMDRMAEDFGLDLQARGHDGCDHIMAVRQQGRGHKLAFMRCTVRIFDKIKAAGR